MEFKFKVIKDSVHGYIEIPEKIIEDIIDTPYFQRLNRIEQTSMRVLYPSARHDRFIHSIGTYYLGCKAFEHFKNNFISEYGKKQKREWESWKISFELACLLHDVGHSPFSHTLEELFQSKQYVIEAGKRSEAFIDYTLKLKMKNFFCKKHENDAEIYIKEFLRDYGRCSPAPHERVSAIVILECFSEVINDLKADIELIVRSIIGCVYTSPRGEKGIKNCLVRMLNSNLIDVDKLDYISRDTMLTGFENISIDTERLLRSMTAYKSTNDDYFPAYNKNALSVIQNVITANNSQQAWIVNHHTVIYNAYLLKTAINKLAKIMSDDYKRWLEDVFSVDCIIKKIDIPGKKENVSINMLCDDDLWHLLKRHMEEIPEVREMLDRRIRKTALWKSLAEYTMLFDAEEKQGEYSFNGYSSCFANACTAAASFSGYLNVDSNTPDFQDNSNGDYVTCSTIIEEFCKENAYDSKQFVILKGGETHKNKAVIARDALVIKFGGKEKPYKEVMRYYNTAAPIQEARADSRRSVPYFFIYCNASSKIDKGKFLTFIKKRQEFKNFAT